MKNDVLVEQSPQQPQQQSQQQPPPQLYNSDTLILNDLCHTPGISLSQFLNEIDILHPELQELTLLFRTIPTACQMIMLQALPNHQSMASEIMKRTIRQSNVRIGILTSEIEEEAVETLEEVVEENDTEEPNIDEATTTNNNNNSFDFQQPYQNQEEIIIAEGPQYCTIIHPLLHGDDDIGMEYDNNVPTGSVISIYERDIETCYLPDPTVVLEEEEEDDDTDQCLAHTLQPGTNLVAAAYCYYSNTFGGTQLVFSILQSGVFVFQYHEPTGIFQLIKSNVQIPTTSNVYRTTANLHSSDYSRMEEPIRRMMNQWNQGTGITKTKFRHRYLGNTVADVHSIIMNGQGGVYYHSSSSSSSFSTPSMSDTETNINNGVQLLYVAAPLSYIIEQAGGMSYTIVVPRTSSSTTPTTPAMNDTNDSKNHMTASSFMVQRVLEISPTVVHERIPILLGSKIHMEEIMNAYKNDHQE